METVLAGLASIVSTEALLDLGTKLLHSALLALGGYIAIRFSFSLIDRIFSEREATTKLMDKGRAITLSGLLKSISRYTIDFIAVVAILDVFNFPVQQFIAGAGILGLAIGFGAQNLVRDFISGFFILFEDQYAVGDYIETAGVSGTVEEMGLRITKIRDFGGQVHTIPNGSIDKVTNMSRGDMRVLVEVGISYEDDINRATEVINQVCQDMIAEFPVITEGPKVLGVSDLADSSVNILVWAKTKPMEQWAIGRELRKRIKQAFDENDVEIPYPRRVQVPIEATKIEKASHE